MVLAVKNTLAMPPTPVFLPGETHAQSMGLHSGLQSMGLQRVAHDWSIFAQHIIELQDISLGIQHNDLIFHILQNDHHNKLPAVNIWSY